MLTWTRVQNSYSFPEATRQTNNGDLSTTIVGLEEKGNAMTVRRTETFAQNNQRGEHF